MAGLNLHRFLEETGISLRKLSMYLQVAESYLAAATAGTARLTRRDEAACRQLWRRLAKRKQLALPFEEPIETFSRDHARVLARARANYPAKAARRTRPMRPSPAQPALLGGAQDGGQSARARTVQGRVRGGVATRPVRVQRTGRPSRSGTRA
ncbi:MAG: hypothetical protein HY712_07340 [candidate division NC10 bacterium]|nr:hypothetical protein [candidate division NC10 bacterium]